MKFGGTPALALEKALTEHRVAMCSQIITEVEKILTTKFAWQLPAIAQRFDVYLLNAIWIPVPGTLTGISRDPKDDFILECAVLAQASLILSGDKDLLSLQTYEGIRIISSREFVGNAA